jgi:hypothetical protein
MPYYAEITTGIENANRNRQCGYRVWVDFQTEENWARYEDYYSEYFGSTDILRPALPEGYYVADVVELVGLRSTVPPGKTVITVPFREEEYTLHLDRRDRPEAGSDLGTLTTGGLSLRGSLS